MNPKPMAREWLRIVKYFKSQARLRGRAPKSHEKGSDPAASGPQRSAKEL